MTTNLEKIEAALPVKLGSEEFKKLQKNVLGTILAQDPVAARKHLVECCDFCLAHNTAEFDTNLEQLNMFCSILEIKLFGNAAAKKEMKRMLKQTLQDSTSTPEIIDLCMETLNEGDLAAAKSIREALPKKLTGERAILDKLILAHETIQEEFAKDPEKVVETLKLVDQTNQTNFEGRFS